MTLDTYIWVMKSHLKLKYSQRTKRAGVSSSNIDVSCNFSHSGLRCQPRRVQQLCEFFNTQKLLQLYQLVAFSKLNSSYRMDTIQSGTFLWIPDRALNELLPVQFAVEHKKLLALRQGAYQENCLRSDSVVSMCAVSSQHCMVWTCLPGLFWGWNKPREERPVFSKRAQWAHEGDRACHEAKTLAKKSTYLPCFAPVCLAVIFLYWCAIQKSWERLKGT